MIGIYKITNKINGKSYIGQSIDIKRRWREHRNSEGLNTNPLYLDFKKYGIKNFNFEILEICNVDELDDKEILWIDRFNTYNNGYNLTKGIPNQLFGKICKPKYKEKGMKFMYIGIDEIREAAKNLTPSGFKLYLYFAENEDGWEFNLSPKNFQKAYGLAESTYRKAKQELIDKGYIVEHKHNHFVFYSCPADAAVPLDEIRKEINRLAGHIKEYDRELYAKFSEEAKATSGLEEAEKKKAGLDILKRMRKELDKLEIDNSDFGF